MNLLRAFSLITVAAGIALCPVNEAATRDETLTYVVDRVLVEDLFVEYLNARDSIDADRLAMLLAPDVETLVQDTVVSKGRDKHVEAMRREGGGRLNPGQKSGEFGNLRHLCTNIIVEVHGSTSSASCYQLTTAFDQAANKPEILSVGRYAIENVKINGRWYVSKIRMMYDQGNDDLAKALQLGRYHSAADNLPQALRK